MSASDLQLLTELVRTLRGYTTDGSGVTYRDLIRALDQYDLRAEDPIK